MPWHVLINDPCTNVELVDATELMDNFAYRLQNVLPLNNVGIETDNTYNLGSAVFRWNNGYFGGDLYVDGNIYSPWTNQFQYACFIRTFTPQITFTIGVTAYNTPIDTLSTTDALFPGWMYLTYEGALEFRYSAGFPGLNNINQYIIFPIYSADISNASYTIPCDNDDTLSWKLISSNNGLVSSGTKVTGGGNLVVTGGGGGAIPQGHYILAIMIDNSGLGPTGITLGRWMRDENVSFSPTIVTNFIESTNRRIQPAPGDIWSWTTLGDGVAL